MSLFYAGIGSRETPANMLAQMSELAYDLAEEGWTLRSGAAPGADTAFERGLLPQHPREIFLPWPGFSSHESKLWRPSAEAYALAAEIHPAWERCGRGARSLHARNCHQVLGSDLSTPSTMVICWTKDGAGGGGTGQAIRLARSRGIPVFDLGRGLAVVDEIREFLREQRREQGAQPR